MDMLVRLYDLKPRAESSGAAEGNALIRAPIGPEYDLVRAWIAIKFSAGWSSEAGVALANRPPTLFIAQQDENLVGFSCFDATARGFFGPIGVDEGYRGRGIGAALLHHTMQAMRAHGYGYAIVGAVGAGDFFRKEVQAMEIPESKVSVYRHLLRERKPGSAE